MGAGSAWKAPRQRSVGDITRYAAKPARLGQLLYRIARYYRPARVVELGTSLGFSTAYLAAGAAHGGGGADFGVGRGLAVEGCGQGAAAAGGSFHSLGFEGQVGAGNFEIVVPGF